MADQLVVPAGGGFDQYLAELAGLTPAQLADDEALNRLAERYDIWPG